jgi:S-adenosylmethionine:tRNA ribosyltransferase-isomerase
MSNLTSHYDYHLPIHLIAQTPAKPRESAKLMVLDRKADSTSHQTISDLPQFFRPGDIVVVNNTKVFHARLQVKLANHTQAEVFLLRPLANNHWLAIGKPGKKLTPGTILNIAPYFQGKVVTKNLDHTFTIDFGIDPDEVITKANLYGQVPIPPYIHQIPEDKDYQTSYAKVTGSVAAPTAGFHLTKNIRRQLQEKGVQILELTLHVGLGTFLPVKTESLKDHTMHSEWVNLTPDVAYTITQAKINDQRIFAIGTTTVRTLEGIATQNQGKLVPFTGDLNLFIKPGFKFQIINGLLTNFHLPKSTLLVLVSALAGRQKILNAYQEAIDNNYRFFSFGDAMLIL